MLIHKALTCSPFQKPASVKPTADAPSNDFQQRSRSDVPLEDLEELLEHISTSDVYVGPLRTAKGFKQSSKRSSFAAAVKMPQEKQPLPMGEIRVQKVWNVFAEVDIDTCNKAISKMQYWTLRQCAHANGLNQLGSATILRKRLRSFVHRVRGAVAGAGGKDFPPLKGTPVENTNLDNDGNAFKMTELDHQTVLTADTFYDYLLIIDIEATCEDETLAQSKNFPQEIIEFPVLLYDTRQRKVVGVFHSYCRPVKRPELTEFCKDLTHITQTQVDEAVEFPQLLCALNDWLFEQNDLRNKRWAVVCDNSADMAQFMWKQCQMSSVPMPPWAKVWVNLNVMFRQFYRIPFSQKTSLIAMLKFLGLTFMGSHHSGLFDSLNILRVLQIMLADGCKVLINQKLDLRRKPTHMTSITCYDALSAYFVPRTGVTLWRTMPYNPSVHSAAALTYGHRRHPIKATASR